MPDMQAVRRGIEPHVKGYLFVFEHLFQIVLKDRLFDKASFFQYVECTLSHVYTLFREYFSQSFHACVDLLDRRV